MGYYSGYQSGSTTSFNRQRQQNKDEMGAVEFTTALHDRDRNHKRQDRADEMKEVEFTTALHDRARRNKRQDKADRRADQIYTNGLEDRDRNIQRQTIQDEREGEKFLMATQDRDRNIQRQTAQDQRVAESHKTQQSQREMQIATNQFKLSEAEAQAFAANNPNLAPVASNLQNPKELNKAIAQIYGKDKIGSYSNGTLVVNDGSGQQIASLSPSQLGAINQRTAAGNAAAAKNYQKNAPVPENIMTMLAGTAGQLGFNVEGFRTADKEGNETYTPEGEKFLGAIEMLVKNPKYSNNHAQLAADAAQMAGLTKFSPDQMKLNAFEQRAQELDQQHNEASEASPAKFYNPFSWFDSAEEQRVEDAQSALEEERDAFVDEFNDRPARIKREKEFQQKKNINELVELINKGESIPERLMETKRLYEGKIKGKQAKTYIPMNPVSGRPYRG